MRFLLVGWRHVWFLLRYSTLLGRFLQRRIVLLHRDRSYSRTHSFGLSLLWLILWTACQYLCFGREQRLYKDAAFRALWQPFCREVVKSTAIWACSRIAILPSWFHLSNDQAICFLLLMYVCWGLRLVHRLACGPVTSHELNWLRSCRCWDTWWVNISHTLIFGGVTVAWLRLHLHLIAFSCLLKGAGILGPLTVARGSILMITYRWWFILYSL